jgi:4-amino-4-deoxy-L-arabinose transferase-like glycosyltransferase
LQMAQLLRAGQFRDWMNYDAPLATFHARIYSVAYALFGNVLGEGILAVEPVNLIYYLSILILTYLIGSVVFSPTVGRLAAFIVGLWPSLLVYSTQLVRDPLFTGAYLLLLFTLIICIKQKVSLRQSFVYATYAK